MFQFVRNVRIGPKLIVLMGASLVILLVAMLLVTSNSIQSLALTSGKRRSVQEAQIIEGQFENATRDISEAVGVMAQSPGLVDAVESGEELPLQTLLLIRGAQLALDNVDVVDAQGGRLAAVNPEELIEDVSGKEQLFSLGLLGIQTAGFVMTEEDGKAIIRLAAVTPLRNTNGEIVGALLASRTINDEYLATLNFSREDVSLAIVYEGQVAAVDKVSAQRADEFQIDTFNNFGINQALDGQLFIEDQIVTGVGGKPYLRAYVPLNIDGTISPVAIVQVGLSDIFSLRGQLVQNNIAVAAVLGALLLGFATYIALHNIVRPLGYLQSVALAMAEGDYKRRVEIRSGDEIGQLGNSFNEMAAAIQSREQNLIAARREAEEASRLKDEFLSVMSHELRTPLNAILGYQGILAMMGALDDESLDMVQRTQANARRLVELINDILDISRIEAGRMDIVPMELDLSGFIDRIQSQIQVLADEKQIEFTVSLANTLPATIYTDEDALTKILVNLLGNAVKFTDEGSVNLRVTSQNGSIQFAVSDTGVGIPVHMHEIIFERFRQVDGSTTRQHGGSGLGLAIVQQICHLMGGQIAVDSEIGQGSTFKVTLPWQAIMAMEKV